MQHMLRHSIQNGTLPRRYGGDSGTALNTGIFVSIVEGARFKLLQVMEGLRKLPMSF